MKDEHIDKLVEETMNSADGAGKALPKPFLFTRIMARMEGPANSGWEKAVRFIARPAVMAAGLFLVIAINISVIAFNNTNKTTATNTSTELANTDEFSTSLTNIYNFENAEQ